MGKLKDKVSGVLYKIRNPQYDKREKQYRSEINFKRLLIALPFIIAAIIFLALSLDS